MLGITIGLASYATEAEVYTAKPWLKPGSVRRVGPEWHAIDSTDGKTYVVGRVPDHILAGEAAQGFSSGGLPNFGLTKTGDFYDPASPAATAQGGLIPLPGLGLLGGGGNRWWLWLLLAAGVILVAGGLKGRQAAGKALQARIAGR